MKVSRLLGVVMALCSASALQAQEDLRLPADLWREPTAVATTAEPENVLPWETQDEFDRGRVRAKSDLVVNAALHGRWGIPFGSADRDVFVYGGGIFLVDQQLSWSDLFHSGWGFDLELDIMFGDASGRGRMRTPGFDYGAFVALMVDEFSGGSVSDSLGNFIHPDNLNMNTFLVGAKVIQSFDQGFFADGRFGLGAVHYSAVNATFGGPLIPDFRDELLQDTWTFAMDLRGHGGIRVGPVGFTIGMGFRLLAPPSEGARVSLDSGPLWVFDIDLGVELGF
jgi:hypothetical protein